VSVDRPVAVHAVVPYWGRIRGLIKALKYDGDTAHLAFLGHLLYRYLDRHIAREQVDLILANPTHPARATRHAELLVAAMVHADQDHRWVFDDPARPSLVKTHPNERSRGQDIQGRQAAAQALGRALEVRRPDALVGQRVLVVDDVVTTGAQLQVVADLLRAHGAAEVSGLVVAAVRLPAP
jgi:predicted amidophosphoribosyltransferase